MSDNKSRLRVVSVRLEEPLARWVEDQTTRFGISGAAITKIALTEKRERELREVSV